MGDLRKSLEAIRANVTLAAEKSGRSAGDITVLAATKQQSVDRIQEIVLCGIDACGENRVQEMLSKQEAFRGAPLHFIGQLQKNKVKHVVGLAELIHSVDSIELAQQISLCAKAKGIVQEVLVECNVGAEVSKSGFLVDNLCDSAVEIAKLESVFVRGLMCIPPLVMSEESKRELFTNFSKVFVDISTKVVDNNRYRGKELKFDILSMGMSNDYSVAIECGSTLIRVGTALFGSRNY